MSFAVRSVIVALLFLSALAFSAQEQAITLHAGTSIYTIVPATLELTAHQGQRQTIVSRGTQTPLKVVDLRTTSGGASWQIEPLKLRVAVRSEDSSLLVTFEASDDYTSLTWPVQPLSRDSALIWPAGQGQYVPLSEDVWRHELVSQTWDTLEGLSMPFWGTESDAGFMSSILDIPYHNEISFAQTSVTLELRFSHEFRKAEGNGVAFRFRVTPPAEGSAIQPAQDFRTCLQQTGQFVSFRDKIRNTTVSELLLGAPQVYLWGGDVITRFDFPPKGLNRFCKQLVSDAASSRSSHAIRLRALLPAEEWQSAEELAKSEYQLAYAQTSFCAALSKLMRRPEFADEFPSSDPGVEAGALLKKHNRSLRETVRLNSLLLHSAYPEQLPHPDKWGGSFNVSLLKSFKDAGVDRFRICLPDWQPLAFMPRDYSQEAARLGYLIGPYDSYHSIHDPKTSGTDSSWPTAQFDERLFEEGAIERRDGTKRKGFKQKGYLLSPVAARPYVEQRVSANFALAPFNYYFLDCDGFGQVYDDYSPLHSGTQMSDAAARVARIDWISKRFNVPVGTEGGTYYAARAAALFEGIVNPSFGWGDPDMSNTQSKYFVGRYFPPDAPAVFFKPVPAKEKYVRTRFDPRYRLPLWEVVFHDSAISTHHWSASSLKFSNVQTTVALTEMLYQVPPVYHLNPEEWERRKAHIVDQYRVFSPLHSKTGTLPLNSFGYLSPDRLVQKTTFGTDIEVIANYGQEKFEHQGQKIAPGSALIRHKDERIVFVPPSN